ncbi:hypothetical protein MCC93_03430 [Morococcus cerebrosus]|uniref:Uncharacterized protein n=1 Tax=Morococcus cerebrosus TaxID=1056807 RepID=A0A0C1EUJ0_9NEIS|nr:hypothetical protein MCC93_03430 [Morococcus cerebrosus]
MFKRSSEEIQATFLFWRNNFKNVIDYVKISRIIQLIRKHKASLNNLKG